MKKFIINSCLLLSITGVGFGMEPPTKDPTKDPFGFLTTTEHFPTGLDESGFKTHPVGTVPPALQAQLTEIFGPIGDPNSKWGVYEEKTIAELDAQIASGRTFNGQLIRESGGGTFQLLEGNGTKVANIWELQAHPLNNGAVFQMASNFDAIDPSLPTVPTREDSERALNRLLRFDPQAPSASLSAAPGFIYRRYIHPHIDLYLPPTIKIGIHRNILVTFRKEVTGKSKKLVPMPTATQRVTQIFFSTLDFRASPRPSATDAQNIMDTAYEGTIKTAVAYGKKQVFLTLIGCGVFGNRIDSAITAIAKQKELIKKHRLNVTLVIFRKLEQEAKTDEDVSEVRNHLIQLEQDIRHATPSPRPIVSGAPLSYESLYWRGIYTDEGSLAASHIRNKFLDTLFNELERHPELKHLLTKVPDGLSAPTECNARYNFFIYHNPLTKEVFNLLASSHDAAFMFMMVLSDLTPNIPIELQPSSKRMTNEIFSGTVPGSYESLMTAFIASFFDWFERTNGALKLGVTPKALRAHIANLFAHIIESVVTHAEEVCTTDALHKLTTFATTKGITPQLAIQDQLVDYFLFITTNDAHKIRWYSSNTVLEPSFLSETKTTLESYNSNPYTAVQVPIPGTYVEARTTLRANLAHLLARDFINEVYASVPLERLTIEEIYYDMFKKLAAYISASFHYPHAIDAPDVAAKEPEAGTKLGDLYGAVKNLGGKLRALSYRLESLKTKGSRK